MKVSNLTTLRIRCNLRGSKGAEVKHKNCVTVQIHLDLSAVSQLLINKFVAWLQITALPHFGEFKLPPTFTLQRVNGPFPKH